MNCNTPTDLQFMHGKDEFQPSLLQELYNDADIDDSSSPYEHQSLPMPFPNVYRRATFPYVRHDREDIQLYQPNLNFYPDYYPVIKHEDQPQLIVPSQQQPFFPHQQPLPPLSYLPHSSMPVQHTDDAASKETQYLRRRCFNCHTTEPPSWRRSTLNPGKIVCNKCGLYERTHLRPRPLRFDELRAGNKARKNSNAAATRKDSLSPNVKAASVKKEPRDYALPRRASVSSSASSSASGASDWDDNLSVYSSSPSAPPTSFNSPSVPSFPLSRDSHSPPILDPSLSQSSLPPLSDSSSSASSPSASSSHSPNPHTMIRLPNAPLNDIASYSPHPAQLQHHHPYPPTNASSPLSSPLPLHQHHQHIPLHYPNQNGYPTYNPYAASTPMSFAAQPMYAFDAGLQQSPSAFINAMGTGLMGPPSPLSSISSLPSTPSTPAINANPSPSSVRSGSPHGSNATPTTRRRGSGAGAGGLSPQALSLSLEEPEHDAQENPAEERREEEAA